MYFLFNRTTLQVFVTYLIGTSFTCIWRWNRQWVPKRRQLELRRRGITQKRTNYTLQVLYMSTLCDSTGLLKMIVGVLTTCHTQYTWDRSICIFYLIEQHSKFLLHTLQALYMCTLCDSTNISTIIEFVPTVCNMSAVSTDYRVDICRITKGAHIEHL